MAVPNADDETPAGAKGLAETNALRLRTSARRRAGRTSRRRAVGVSCSRRPKPSPKRLRAAWPAIGTFPEVQRRPRSDAGSGRPPRAISRPAALFRTAPLSPTRRPACSTPPTGTRMFRSRSASPIGSRSALIACRSGAARPGRGRQPLRNIGEEDRDHGDDADGAALEQLAEAAIVKLELRAAR